MKTKAAFLFITIIPLLGCFTWGEIANDRQVIKFVSDNRLRQIRDNCELPLGLIHLLEFDTIEANFRNGQLGVIFYIANPECLTSDIVMEPRFLADSLFVPSCYVGSDLLPIIEAIDALMGGDTLSYPSIGAINRLVIVFNAKGYSDRDNLDGLSLNVKKGRVYDGGRFYTSSEH